MEYRYLKVQQSDNIVTCIMSNPPRHTIVEAEVKELLDLLDRLEKDKSAGILLLTGESSNIFIAHYEIGELAETSEKQQGGSNAPEEKPKKLHRMNRLCLSLERSRLITIAALNGDAAGGGWEIALACDFRLSRKGTHQFGQPETNVGIIPGAGGTQRMARLLGTAKALDLILHGRLFSPDEAFELGLLHRLYGEENFAEAVDKFARKLARRSPLALAAAKKAIHQGIQAGSMEDALLIEQACFDSAMGSEDAAGAMRAWLKGEKYHWKGR